jgi:acid phosphatase
MGRLLQDLSAKLALKVSPKTKGPPSAISDEEAPRLLVHSTHDTALAALLATLDVFDEK